MYLILAVNVVWRIDDTISRAIRDSHLTIGVYILRIKSSNGNIALSTVKCLQVDVLHTMVIGSIRSSKLPRHTESTFSIGLKLIAVTIDYLEVCAQSQLGVCIIESLSIESTGASAPELNRNLYRLSLSNGISNTIVQATPVFESKVEYILCLRVVISPGIVTTA